MLPLYDLTPYIGKNATSNRTVVLSLGIAGFDVSARTRLLIIGGAIVGLIPAGILAPIVGWYGMILVLITPAAAVWLLNTRTNRGTGQLQYRALIDRRRFKPGTFYLCGQPLDLHDDQWITVIANTVPYGQPAPPTPVHAAAAPPADTLATLDAAFAQPPPRTAWRRR